MSEHYYTRQPQVESKEALTQVTLRGKLLRLYSDRGVFSKSTVDFGSQLLIESVVADEDAKIIDVGCGYGPIGLSLAKESTDRKVTLIDMNIRAIALAEKNAQLNGIHNVQVFESDLFSGVEAKEFDIVISNPPIRAGKIVVHSLFEQGYQHLREGGELWIVIQKKQGFQSAYKKLELLFEKVDEVTKKKGYRIIRAIK